MQVVVLPLAAGQGVGDAVQECLLRHQRAVDPEDRQRAAGADVMITATAAYGGNPADFGHASVAEQNQVFAAAMATPGGDYGPLHGTFDGEQLVLMVFNGVFIYRFDAELLPDGTLAGEFRSGYHVTGGAAVLVRPDGYLGYRTDDLNADRLAAYLARVFAPPADG